MICTYKSDGRSMRTGHPYFYVVTFCKFLFHVPGKIEYFDIVLCVMNCCVLAGVQPGNLNTRSWTRKQTNLDVD